MKCLACHKREATQKGPTGSLVVWCDECAKRARPPETRPLQGLNLTSDPVRALVEPSPRLSCPFCGEVIPEDILEEKRSQERGESS
jgi:hypothetical protein